MYTKSNYVNITITISPIKIDRWFHHLSHKSNFANITISLSLSLIDHLLHFRVLHQKLIGSFKFIISVIDRPSPPFFCVFIK
ncbi:hypothetical protein HanLR1_Chr16g0612481 [Helianthus annuus]|nr:hypothetical protein HanLR1_Chr16g0612481 [Helianthus annuus]